MKKFTLLLFTSFSATYLLAQNYTLSPKLTARFVEIYQTTNKEENYVTRLAEAAAGFFIQDHDVLEESIKTLQKKYKMPADSIVNIIFDSIMLSFSKNHMWGEYADKKERFLPVLEKYNKVLCPCIGKKIEMVQPIEEKDFVDCGADLATDTSYKNGLLRAMGTLTIKGAQEVAEMANIYMHQHCEEWYRFILLVVQDEVIWRYISDREDKFYDIEKKIFKFYKTQSPELTKLFPDYKKYEPDLKTVSNILGKKSYVLRFSDQKIESSGQFSIILTYYDFDKGSQPILHGQLVYTLKEGAPEAPVVSLRFTPGSKMKDRNKYLEQIKKMEELEPPPPPMIEMLKVDSTKKNN